MNIDKLLLDPSIEVRSCPGELRAMFDEATGVRTLIGYASVWGALSSVPLKTPKGDIYFERAIRGTYLDSLDSPEIGCFFDHDTSKILGRTGAGTLIVSEDDHGLLYQCVLPNTSTALDLAVSISRGDVWGCSVGFYSLKDSWARDGQGRLIRTVEKARLFDVSPVSRPTFRETAVSFRSLDLFQAEEPSDLAERIAYLDRRIRLAKLSPR